MNKNLKELLAHDEDRYICGQSGYTKLFVKYDSKGREEFVVARQYFKDDLAEEIYRGLDEDEAVKVFSEYD